MHRRHKHDIIVILALVGFATSVYLAVTKYLGITVPCDLTQGCETVLASKYSIFLGLPLSVWGIAFYSAVIVSALLANHYGLWRKILTWVLGGGSAASLVFLSLQFFIIKQVCQYCLLVDVLTIVLFIIDLNIEHRQNADPV